MVSLNPNVSHAPWHKFVKASRARQQNVSAQTTTYDEEQPHPSARELHTRTALLNYLHSSEHTVANAVAIGADNISRPTERGRQNYSPGRASDLHLPKNRSTGNLLHMGRAGTEKARIRFSFDAGIAGEEYDTMSR